MKTNKTKQTKWNETKETKRNETNEMKTKQNESENQMKMKMKWKTKNEKEKEKENERKMKREGKGWDGMGWDGWDGMGWKKLLPFAPDLAGWIIRQSRQKLSKSYDFFDLNLKFNLIQFEPIPTNFYPIWPFEMVGFGRPNFT